MTDPNEGRPAWLPEVDLLAVTQYSQSLKTIIDVKADDDYFYRWLRFGSLGNTGAPKSYYIGAYYTGVTDPEHGDAYALYFEVRGLELQDIHRGHIILRAWVAGADPDGDEFRVPFKSIMSLDEIGGHPCSFSGCDDGDHHLIVDYLPPTNLELWKKLRGRELRITIVPRHVGDK